MIIPLALDCEHDRGFVDALRYVRGMLDKKVKPAHVVAIISHMQNNALIREKIRNDNSLHFSFRIAEGKKKGSKIVVDIKLEDQ